MTTCSRRDAIRSLAALSFMGWSAGRVGLADALTAVSTREFDISAYNSILLPREHGQLYQGQAPIYRRYPSRDHCMQMAAFFNNTEGMLVIANDPRGAIADWEIIPGSVLKIHFYGAVPNVQVHRIEPTVAAAAARYRQWAQDQFWVRGRARDSLGLNFISVASSSTMAAEQAHFENVYRSMTGPIGVWFTQWRQYAFDRMYPDYTPKEPAEFARFLSGLRTRGAVAMPYVNAVLWDENFGTFRQIGEDLAVRTATLEKVPYNQTLSFLYYACPFAKGWQDTIVAARNALKDADGMPLSGVYLDMLAAAAPQQCWAANHGHEPGDPYAWQQGLRALLARIPGQIMVEGCAEVYLDVIDYPLMHLHTASADSTPLWKSVYGDLVKPVGWKLSPGIGVAQFGEVLRKANSYGVGAGASPWMIGEAEAALFSRGLGEAASSPGAPGEIAIVPVN